MSSNNYRLRKDAWRHIAIDQGIKPTARAVAREAGISRSTMTRLMAGSPPSGAAIARLTDTLNASVDDLFEKVDHD